jgi:D-alanyl-D-alanine carboxypeptidase/D-alanyl-D-alanine-endopeptidase (penicillin-binding protein 4)
MVMNKRLISFKNRNIFKILLSFAVLLLQTACAQTSDDSFEAAWQKFINRPELKHANVGLLISDAQTGEQIHAFRNEKILMPASVQKLISTAYALETLGPDYRFKTEVAYSGKPDSLTGILNGNLYVIGGGDPTLASKYFAGTGRDIVSETIQELKAHGIKKINGRIIALDGIYGTQRAPSTWGWQDIANYYASGASGLSYSDNDYTLVFDTRCNIGELVSLKGQKPEVPGMTFINEVTAYEGKSDLSYIHGSEYSNLRYIRGKLPDGEADYEIRGSLPNPPLYLAQIIEASLKENQIQVAEEAECRQFAEDVGWTRIVQIFSPELQHIVQKTNRHSINLYAEHLLRQPLAVQKPAAGIDEALDSMRMFWQRKALYNDAVKYYDGAGLSLAAGLSPQHLADILFYMKHHSSSSGVFIESLPVSGEQGTLRYFLHKSPAKGQFRLKSGSFTGIRSYAGYGTTKSGRELIAVLMINHFTGDTYALRNKMADLFESMYLTIE